MSRAWERFNLHQDLYLSGDDSALPKLFEIIHSTASRYALPFSKRRGMDAEDIAQDACLYLLKRYKDRNWRAINPLKTIYDAVRSVSRCKASNLIDAVEIPETVEATEAEATQWIHSIEHDSRAWIVLDLKRFGDYGTALHYISSYVDRKWIYANASTLALLWGAMHGKEK